MKTRLKWTIALATLTCPAAACGWHQDDAPAAATAQPSAADLPAPGKPDPWITTQLQARYFTDPVVRGNDVMVSTTDGVVTLRGTVPSQAAQQRAATLAREINGVVRVDDQLTLEPNPLQTGPSQVSGNSEAGTRPGAEAAWTTTKIQAQYFADPGVKGRDIDVTADGAGVVTLRGEVDSAVARAAAVRIAGATEGVTRVVDELRVVPPANGGDVVERVTDATRDAWITATIRSKYFLDVDVKKRDLDVDTQNGVVTLTGTVESPAERRQAVDLARTTAFVRDVVDRLTLAATTALTGAPKGPGAVVPQLTGNAGAPAPPDGWITTSILAKFFLSKALQSQRVEVSTHDGVVTLSGSVGDAAARSAAEEIARGTKGVRSVVNGTVVAASS
jgi:osmotically-inducible protein OsmY